MAKELKGGLPSSVEVWTSGHGGQSQNLYHMGECKGHSGDGELGAVLVEGNESWDEGWLATGCRNCIDKSLGFAVL